MKKALSQDWIATAIAVNHEFTLQELVRLEDLLLDLFRQTAFMVNEAVEQTHATRLLTKAERLCRLIEFDGLSFALRGKVNCEGVVGLRAIQLNLADRHFAWVSRSSLGPAPAELKPLIDATMAVCRSPIALVAPADRLAASATAELICEGLTIEEIVQRIREVKGLDAQGGHDLQEYFQMRPEYRGTRSDTYFRLLS